VSAAYNEPVAALCSFLNTSSEGFFTDIKSAMVTVSVPAQAEVLEASFQKMAGGQSGYSPVICSYERERKIRQRAAQIDYGNADFSDHACCLHILDSCDDTIAVPLL
jgi:hypothetical protein